MTFKEKKFIEGWSMHQFTSDLYPKDRINFQQYYKIYGTNIDSLIKNNILLVPTFIKIDVDGIEHLILKGGKNTLLNSNVKSILVEIDENFKVQLYTILKIMKKNNFIIKEKVNSFMNGKSNKFKNHFNYIFDRN